MDRLYDLSGVLEFAVIATDHLAIFASSMPPAIHGEIFVPVDESKPPLATVLHRLTLKGFKLVSVVGDGIRTEYVFQRPFTQGLTRA